MDFRSFGLPVRYQRSKGGHDDPDGNSNGDQDVFDGNLSRIVVRKSLQKVEHGFTRVLTPNQNRYSDLLAKALI